MKTLQKKLVRPESTWKKRAWAPRRRGEIYCSPACGADCTFAAYETAKDRARTLAMICGKGWRATVWENMGWHYRVSSRSARISVSASHYGKLRPSYAASILDGDAIRWSSEGLYYDPRKAIANVIARAKKDLAEMTELLKGL